MMADDSPQKRKRALDDVGDRDQKKMHLDDFGLGIGELHVDVGEKYLLCQIRKALSLFYLTLSRFLDLAREGLQICCKEVI